MISLLGLASSLLLTTGCSSISAEENEDGKLVKIGSVVSATHPTNVAIREVFEPRIEELTDGKFNVELYDSGVLGGDKQIYDYTRSGIVEFSVVGTPMWSEVPIMSFSDFPFMFESLEHARKVYQGEIGEQVASVLEAEEPLQVLSWHPNGSRVFSSSYDLASIDDFKGLKVRMPNNPIHVRVAESLGANVVIMDLGEVFTSLEQGVIDGQDNPLATFRNEGWYEVQNSIYETNHIIAALELLAGNEFWDTLTDKEKEIFEQVAKETSDYSWDLYEKAGASDKGFMEEKGLTYTVPTDEERSQMSEMMAPVYEYLYNEYDWAEDLVEQVKAAK